MCNVEPVEVCIALLSISHAHVTTTNFCERENSYIMATITIDKDDNNRDLVLKLLTIREKSKTNKQTTTTQNKTNKQQQQQTNK